MTLLEKTRYIWNLWRGHRRFFVLLAVLTAISSGVAVAYPYVLKIVIDDLERVLKEGATGTAKSLARPMWVLAAVMVGRFVAGFYPAFRSWVNLRIESDIRARLFARILEKDWRFQRKFRTGDIVTRLTDDIGEYSRIAWFSCSGIFRAIDSGAKAGLSLVAMIALDWRLALVSILPLPFTLMLFYRVQKRLRDGFEAQQQAMSKTNDLIESAFAGVKIVKAFSAEEGQTSKLAQILDERTGVQLSVVKLMALFQITQQLGTRVGQVMALGVGGAMVVRGHLELGTLYAFYVYLDLLVMPLQDLPNLLVTGRQAFVSVDRIEEVANFPAEPTTREAAPGAKIEAIDLRQVAVQYDEVGARALEGIDLSLKRGERLAVVGGVGSGKSTLLRVLTGLVRPSRGEMTVNGQPAADRGWPGIRGRIGYVPQEAQLFSETVRDNVALGRIGATTVRDASNGAASSAADEEAEIERAIDTAQLTGDLTRLEKGAQTVLGARGSLVSGGQRARIAVARALARRPDVLLLDDSTAALDARSEERFWSALDAAYPGLTTVVTSHRLATVRRADRVLMLDRGRIVDCGRHEELLARRPEYRELLAAEERAAHLVA